MGSTTRREDESTENKWVRSAGHEGCLLSVVCCLLPAFYRSIIGTKDTAVSVRMFTSQQNRGDEARFEKEEPRGRDIESLD
jgi:hypothetical protein